MTVDWYDLLDVPRDADTDAIRTAWKAAVADLDPTDKSFRLYNQAAEVLLDPTRKAAYDATLAADEEPALEPESAPDPVPDGADRVLTPLAPAPASRWEPPTWLLIGLALLTVAIAGIAAYLVITEPSDEEIVEATASAQTAAERAVVPVLSYDYRQLQQTHDAAVAELTDEFRPKYEQLFTVIEENAPTTKTVVTVTVVASAVVQTGEDRAEILLFVNRPTTNKATKEPIVYRDQVTLTMERDGDAWLVDEMKTSPAGS